MKYSSTLRLLMIDSSVLLLMNMNLLSRLPECKLCMWSLKNYLLPHCFSVPIFKMWLSTSNGLLYIFNELIPKKLPMTYWI